MNRVLIANRNYREAINQQEEPPLVWLHKKTAIQDLPCKLCRPLGKEVIRAASILRALRKETFTKKTVKKLQNNLGLRLLF